MASLTRPETAGVIVALIVNLASSVFQLINHRKLKVIYAMAASSLTITLPASRAKALADAASAQGVSSETLILRFIDIGILQYEGSNDKPDMQRPLFEGSLEPIKL